MRVSTFYMLDQKDSKQKGARKWIVITIKIKNDIKKLLLYGDRTIYLMDNGLVAYPLH